VPVITAATAKRNEIYQAFSFEDDNDLARHAQILSDRQRRHGVGRRDDGAKYETYRQRQSDQTVEQISSHGHR
jgi:hypothetical protein